MIRRKVKLESEKSKSREIDYDQMRIEVKIQASRRLAAFEKEYSELQEKLLQQFKKDLACKFEVERAVILSSS